MAKKIEELSKSTQVNLLAKLEKVEEENRNLRKREKILESRLEQLESSKKVCIYNSK